MAANKLPFCHLSHPFSSPPSAFGKLMVAQVSRSNEDALRDLCISSPDSRAEFADPVSVGIPENVTVNVTVDVGYDGTG